MEINLKELKLLGFKEYLLEGRDAPLFHGSSSGNVNNMLEENMISSETLQKIDGKNLKGVSLTRSYKFALTHIGPASFKHGYDVILELDQRLLSQNYKIIPFNWSPSWKGPPKARYMDDLGSEFEEFVVGPIRNLNKYIVKIHASHEIYYNASQETKDRSSFLLKHPKLFIDRKFVNA
jgi:hypothetical protein